MYRLRVLAAFALSMLPASTGRAAVDHEAWLRATTLGTSEAFQAYVKDQPDGRHLYSAYHELRRSVPPAQPTRIVPPVWQFAGTYLCPPRDRSPYCVERRARLGLPSFGGPAEPMDDFSGNGGGFGSGAY